MTDHDCFVMDCHRRLERAEAMVKQLSQRQPRALLWSDVDGFLWAHCRHCGVPIFRHYDWSHQGGTPPQDHDAEPLIDGGES